MEMLTRNEEMWKPRGETGAESRDLKQNEKKCKVGMADLSYGKVWFFVRHLYG